jgi:predicted MFS family arabinose efflux permease
VSELTAPGSLDSLSTPAATPRQAGKAQGILLVVASCMPVLGATLIAPVQPEIVAAFPHRSGASVLVSVILTVPALMIGLGALFAGRLIDTLGRVRVLTVALALYAVFGTAPLWLPNLPLILASRVGVGLTEAAIFTCCTTLLGDYFTGSARIRYFGLQTVVVSLSAVVFLTAGGVLGQGHWRIPFAVYAIALPLASLAPVLLWQPARPAQLEKLPPLDWRRLRRPCLITLVGGVIFYAPVVELSFKLDAIGVTSVGVIGAISALAAAAQAVSAGIFPKVAGRGPTVLLPIAFGLLAAGLALIGLGQQLPVVAAGAIVANAGGGLLLVTMLTWTVSKLEFDQRARGTGAWTASMFIGQFFCPLVIAAVAVPLGGLGAALVAVAVVSLALALVGRRAAATA